MPELLPDFEIEERYGELTDGYTIRTAGRDCLSAADAGSGYGQNRYMAEQRQSQV